MSKLDLKNELRAIDTKDRGWYKTLTEEERKAYDKQLWVQMRWTSCANDAATLILVNDFANKDFNILKNHQELQLQLLQVSGTGQTRRREWIPPGKGAKKNRLMSWLAEQYPEYSDTELELLAATNDKKVFQDMMEQQGMTKKEIKEIFK